MGALMYAALALVGWALADSALPTACRIGAAASAAAQHATIAARPLLSFVTLPWAGVVAALTLALWALLSVVSNSFSCPRLVGTLECLKPVKTKGSLTQEVGLRPSFAARSSAGRASSPFAET
jgi:hypothetical protein